MDTNPHLLHHTAPNEGHTIITMTNGSTVALEGDERPLIDYAISYKTSITFEQQNGMKFVLNGAHIVHSHYTPEKEQNNNA